MSRQVRHPGAAQKFQGMASSDRLNDKQLLAFGASGNPVVHLILSRSAAEVVAGSISLAVRMAGRNTGAVAFRYAHTNMSFPRLKDLNPQPSILNPKP